MPHSRVSVRTQPRGRKPRSLISGRDKGAIHGLYKTQCVYPASHSATLTVQSVAALTFAITVHSRPALVQRNILPGSAGTVVVVYTTLNRLLLLVDGMKS